MKRGNHFPIYLFVTLFVTMIVVTMIARVPRGLSFLTRDCKPL